MSSDGKDDKVTTVQNAGGPVTVLTTRQAPATVVEAAPPSQRNEMVVTHRSTNTGAIAALAVGIVVLLGGIGLIISQVHFLPAPYSVIVLLGFCLILLIVGASFIDRGADRP